MNVARFLKLHNLILFFILLSRTNIIRKLFFSFIIEGIGTLWLFEFELSQKYRDVTAITSNSVSIFLLNAS